MNVDFELDMHSIIYRHEVIELLASAPHTIAIAKIVAENRNICFDAASYGPCLLSTSPEFRRLWSLLEAEISTMVSLDTARQYVKSGRIDHQVSAEANSDASLAKRLGTYDNFRSARASPYYLAAR